MAKSEWQRMPDHEEHDERLDRIRVHRELGTDVPERVDGRAADDRGQRTEGFSQTQVDEPVVEEELEQAAHVEGEGGGGHAIERIARQIHALEHADDRSGREQDAHDEARKPALPADPEIRGRAPFHEEHVDPRER